MPIHEEIQEELPAFALGALPAKEAARIRAHLASCSRCSLVLKEYEPVVDSLAFAVPLADLPPDLKARTMTRVVAQGSQGRDPEPVAVRPAWRQPRSLAPVLAGAAILIALAALIWNVWQTAQLGQQLATERDFVTMLAYAQGSALTVRGTSAAPEAEGKLYIDPDATVAALVTVNLPQLGSGSVYQVWLTDAGGRETSGGTFTVDQAGNGWLLVRASRPLGNYALVEVTTEPPGGSTVPSGAAVLSAKIELPH